MLVMTGHPKLWLLCSAFAVLSTSSSTLRRAAFRSAFMAADVSWSARGSGYGPSAGGKSSLFSRVAWHWRSACPCQA